jgi:hypothetical protein
MASGLEAGNVKDLRIQIEEVLAEAERIAGWGVECGRIPGPHHAVDGDLLRGD